VAGLVADRAPNGVALSFSEEIIQRGARISVRRIGVRAPAPVRLGAVRRRGRSGVVAPIAGRLAPGAYEVRWSVLGVDGHTVGDRFRFGVAPPEGGPVPGIELIGGASGAGGDRASGDAEGPGTVAARWLGLLAAALLLGGVLLRRALGRLGDGDERWARAGLLALVLGLVSAVAGAISASAISRDGSLDLLLDTGNGRLALARLALVLAGMLAALRLGIAARRTGELALAGTGALALLALGLDGHLQALDGDEWLALPAAAAHVLAAGTWAGGVLALLLLAGPRREGPALGLGEGARALAPVAAVSVLVLGVTGVVAALREVDHTVFLWYTGYGRVVIAKTVLLLGLTALGAGLALRARRGASGRRSPLLLRADAAGLVGVLALAAALAGLVQGRGQALPSQRGNLLGGPATATAQAGDTVLRMAVSPGRPGANTLTAVVASLDGAGDPRPRAVTVRLRGGAGDREVTARLRRTAAGTWVAPVRLPETGTYFASAAIAGATATAPVALTIGDADRFGPDPEEVVQSADLSGAGAERCRAMAQGLALAVGRLNARGGVGGGDKVALRTEDDGGDPARAAAAVRAARGRGARALVAPCGRGARGALEAADGLPAIATDPAAPVVRAARQYRLAPDPAAEGVAMAQYLIGQLRTQRPDAPRRVALLGQAGPNAAARERALTAVLARAGIRVRRLPARTATDPRAMARAVDAAAVLGTVLQGDARTLARALRGAIEDAPRFAPASVVVPADLFDERFLERAGDFGRLGVIQAAGDVVVTSRDALGYVQGARALFRGDRPSVSGLRGFVAGLALAEGLRDGTGPGDIAGRLREPSRFTDAITAPWRADRPERGSPFVLFTVGRFLPARLIPVQAGGESFQGTYFEDGSWQPVTQQAYGPGVPGQPGP
jgi:putative copper export protein/methionine-rich copper-binding protein CopC